MGEGGGIRDFGVSGAIELRRFRQKPLVTSKKKNMMWVFLPSIFGILGVKEGIGILAFWCESAIELIPSYLGEAGGTWVVLQKLSHFKCMKF